MNLSKNFTLNEFCKSYTADRLGIDNTPSPEIVRALIVTASGLQVIRNELCNKFEEEVGIHVSSGYRCLALNKAVGGAENSDHTLGWAADITADDMKPEELVRFCIEQDIQFDQVINEYDKWVHISFNPRMRGHALRADRIGSSKKTVYTRLL